MSAEKLINFEHSISKINKIMIFQIFFNFLHKLFFFENFIFKLEPAVLEKFR